MPPDQPGETPGRRRRPRPDTPLTELIEQHRRGRSDEQLMRDTGLPRERIRNYMPAGRWTGTRRQMPAPEVVAGLADALGVPVLQVQRAVERTVGTPSGPEELSSSQTAAVAAMDDLPEAWQRMIADVVNRISTEVRHHR